MPQHAELSALPVENRESGGGADPQLLLIPLEQGGHRAGRQCVRPGIAMPQHGDRPRRGVEAHEAGIESRPQGAEAIDA